MGKEDKKAQSRISDHTAPLFFATHILPFQKLLTLNKLLFMHSTAFKYAPDSFSNICPVNETRHNDHNLCNNDLFTLPPNRIELFKRVPVYSLPLAWNELPYTLCY